MVGTSNKSVPEMAIDMCLGIELGLETCVCDGNGSHVSMSIWNKHRSTSYFRNHLGIMFWLYISSRHRSQHHLSCGHINQPPRSPKIVWG